MGRIGEGLLHQVAAGLVHAVLAAAKERQDPIRFEAVPQTTNQVVEYGLVLREHQQAFIVSPGSVLPNQALEESDQRVEPGVGNRIEIRDVAACRVKPQSADRSVGRRDFRGEVAGEVLQPRAHDVGRGGLARLRHCVAGTSTVGVLPDFAA
jgi:hypothetical protein